MLLEEILEWVSKWPPGGQFVFILLLLLGIGGFFGGLGTFLTVMFRGYPSNKEKDET